MLTLIARSRYNVAKSNLGPADRYLLGSRYRVARSNFGQADRYFLAANMYMLLKDPKMLHDVRGWSFSEDTFHMIWNTQTRELEFRNFLLFCFSNAVTLRLVNKSECLHCLPDLGIRSQGRILGQRTSICSGLGIRLQGRISGRLIGEPF